MTRSHPTARISRTQRTGMNSRSPEDRRWSLRRVYEEDRSLFRAILLSVWIMYLFHFSPTGTGSDRFVALARSIVERHSITIDAFHQYTGELSYHSGHYYINTNPGLSFFAAPCWAVVYPIYSRLPSRLRELEACHWFLVHFICFAGTTALAGALSASLVALLVYAKIRSVYYCLVAAALYAFGSIAFFFSTRLQQNVVIVLLALLVFAAVRLSCESELRPRGFAAIGVLIGLGLFCDLSALPLLMALLVTLVLGREGWRHQFLLGSGLLLGLIPLLAYNLLAFGDAFRPAQAYMVKHRDIVDSGLLSWFSFPSGRLLWWQLISPSQGVLCYMPYVLLLLWGKTLRSIFSRRESIFLVACVTFYFLWSILVSFSRFNIFGPRYLLPAVPFLCLTASLSISRAPRWVAGPLLGFGFLANAAGAQLGFSTANLFSTVAVFVLRGPWLPVIDWLGGDFASATGHAPTIVTPYGLLLLLVGAQTSIWTAYYLSRRRHGQTFGNVPEAAVVEGRRPRRAAGRHSELPGRRGLRGPAAVGIGRDVIAGDSQESERGIGGGEPQ
jgi:hypothetical protein